MNKRINNASGKPSKNRGPLRRKVFLSTRFALAQRARQDQAERETKEQAARQKVKIEKRGWKNKTRGFFSGVFKQGQRGR